MAYYSRFYETAIKESLKHFPVTAITGPRQCGKSTLVKHLVKDNYIYLDLEKPSDLANFKQG